MVEVVRRPATVASTGAFSGIQQTPIEVGGTLYIATPNGVAAVNAVTGAAKWTFV